MTRTLLIILTFALFNLRTTTNSGRPLPTIFFNENSTSYSSFKSSTEIYTDTLDILNYITKIMVEDSTMRIQIGGHADAEERHPKKVALLRVKKVYEDLKRIGADTSRLSFIVYGDSRQLVSKKMMKKCRQESNSKSCFDQLRQMNRRVGFNWTRVTSPNRSYK